MITERDIELLKALCRYYVLNRPQIQRLCFRDDTTGRSTRRRLQALVAEKFINRTHVQVYSPAAGTAAPAFYPSRKGCEFLAEFCGDEHYLATPTQTPQPHHLFHWLAVSDTHITIDAAIADQADVEIVEWLSEWDVANKDETVPERRYRIYTLIRENPRLICAPDAAFLLAVRGAAKVFYLEQDRNTSGVKQIAASKTPGYAALAERQLHRRHFPQTTLETFGVLMVAPTAPRRDALRKALREKPGSHLWRFVAAPDLTPETFLHGPNFYPCEGDPVSLIRPVGPGANA